MEGGNDSTTAQDETSTILEAIERITERLAYFEGRAVNGHGELVDPSVARAALKQAEKDITVALQALDRADTAGWTRGD